MRRALIIFLSLLFMFGVAAGTYAAYINYEQELTVDEIVSKEKTLTSGRYFEGKFLCELKGKNISKYEYKVEDNALYITFYAKASEKSVLPQDDDGYITVSIDAGTAIETVYYLADGDDSSLTVEKK